MNTDDLITALAADRAHPDVRQSHIWLVAGIAGVLVAGLVFFNGIGPRPDVAAAATTLRFLFKFVVTLALAGSAFMVLDRLARPGAARTTSLVWLLSAPALLLGAVGLELLTQPESQWQALFIFALRLGAPTRPGLAGVIAGLVAGGVAATFYAAHCTDDSPLFVVTWYPLAVAILGVAGGVAGRFFARW
jgi:hypothetical protein